MVRISALTSALVLALAIPAAGHAIQPNGLVLESVVEQEKKETAADGSSRITFTKPDVVVPGDRVRITLRYDNRGREPVTNLKLRNPIADGLQFDGTTDTDGFSVSIDGGTTFGQLADMKLKADDGTERAATTADVTHIMWVLTQAVPAGAKGSVSFFTRVR